MSWSCPRCCFRLPSVEIFPVHCRCGAVVAEDQSFGLESLEGKTFRRTGCREAAAELLAWQQRQAGKRQQLPADPPDPGPAGPDRDADPAE